jgi:hypothetical protein
MVPAPSAPAHCGRGKYRVCSHTESRFSPTKGNREALLPKVQFAWSNRLAHHL